MHVSHKTLIIVSGLIWLAVGVFLLQLGITLLVTSTLAIEIALVLLAAALFIGRMKGRYVLGKSAKKGVERIRSFPNPTSFGNIYSAKYYLLLGGMIALGISIKYLGIPNEVRGMVDVAIGCALITGAILYFREAVAEA